MQNCCQKHPLPRKLLIQISDKSIRGRGGNAIKGIYEIQAKNALLSPTNFHRNDCLHFKNQ